MKTQRLTQFVVVATALTAFVLSTGCGPNVRQDSGGQTPANNPFASDPALASILGNNAKDYTLTGSTGTQTFPSDGSLIRGADSNLQVAVAPSIETSNINTSTIAQMQQYGNPPSNWNPPYTCAGVTVQLIKVINGIESEAGGNVEAAPMKKGAGSAYCDSLATRINRTTAPIGIIINFKSSLDPLAEGYRVRISGAASDYKREACMQSCAMDYWNCGGWDPANYYTYNFMQTAAQRCAKYSLGPVWTSHVSKGKIGISLNNQ